MIAGINSKDEPFIAASDVVGCLNFAKDFVVSGTAADKLFGMAEGLWEPDLVRRLPSILDRLNIYTDSVNSSSLCLL